MNIINKIHQYIQPGRGWYQRATSGIETITIHHTASTQVDDDGTALKRVYNTHVGQGWPGFAYHFFIPKSGNIYQVNNFEDVTWHDGHNWDSIGVCLDGYFHSPHNEYPTIEQLKSLKELLDWLCTQNPQFPAAQQNVYGHRERLATACPGDTFFWKVKKYREKGGAYDFINEEAGGDGDSCSQYKAQILSQIETEKDLRKVLGEITSEKDGIKRELEEKTKTVLSLNELIDKNNRAISKLNDTVSTLEDTLLEKEKRVVGLQEQLKNLPELESQIKYLEERKTKWNEIETKYKNQIAILEKTSYTTAPVDKLLTELSKRIYQLLPVNK